MFSVEIFLPAFLNTLYYIQIQYRLFLLFLRCYNQHHRPPHLILHPRNIHHLFRRLRFDNILKCKSVDQQCIQICGQCTVVFGHVFAKEYCIPLTFIIVAVYGEIKNSALGASQLLIFRTSGSKSLT